MKSSVTVTASKKILTKHFEGAGNREMLEQFAIESAKKTCFSISSSLSY